MNLLAKTKAYLAGNMEFGEDNLSWRAKVEDFLSSINVTVMSPFNPPFLEEVDEGKQDFLKQIRGCGNLFNLEERMKKIRRFDLNLCDRADFIIVYIKPDTPTFGTIDELVHSEGMNKPIFMCVEGGKRKCPLWLFSLVSPRYMYDSVDEVLEKIGKIDSGEVKIDSKRWRLLKKEYR